MTLPEPVIAQLGSDPDRVLDAIPNAPAVFLLWAPQGPPYLARTGVLRRRLKRLLAHRDRPSRLLNLRGVAERLEYWPTASRLEAGLIHYRLARAHFPDTYAKMVKLAMPVWVRMLSSNPWPRTQVTTRLGSTGVAYGPFRSRIAAERFEHDLLELFQLRRCQEDLEPREDHPGCIYGEMNHCLRPCQLIVGPEEYASEARRVEQFLLTGGKSLLEPIVHARDRASEELDFEEAARQHQRHERVREVLALRDELAGDLAHLCGVAVTPSVEPGAAELWFLAEGAWLAPRRFRTEHLAGLSIDSRLRRLAAGLEPERPGLREKQEHVALLARWYHSSWRDGEWFACDSLAELPFRKLVRAISRAAQPRQGPPL